MTKAHPKQTEWSNAVPVRFDSETAIKSGLDELQRSGACLDDAARLLSIQGPVDLDLLTDVLANIRDQLASADPARTSRPERTYSRPAFFEPQRLSA